MTVTLQQKSNQTSDSQKNQQLLKKTTLIILLNQYAIVAYTCNSLHNLVTNQRKVAERSISFA